MITVPYEVKKALRDGMLRKNYRFVVLNDDGTTDFTIDNDTLVSESVNIDERMCSGDTLKFGLCEGSSLEFQYFGKPNITGKRVQAFVDVQYLAGVVGRINASGSFTAPVSGSYTFEVKKGSATGLYITFAGGGDMYVDFVLGQTTDTEELEAGDVVTLNDPSNDALFEVSVDMWDTIPMGFFDIKKCSRQASTGIIKVTAYNKLQSEYLDAKANDLLLESYGKNGENVLIYDIQKVLLDDYQIKANYQDVVPEEGSGFNVTALILNGTPFFFTALYGLETPLSAYQYNTIDDPSLTRAFYIEFDFIGLRYNINTDAYWSFYKHYGDIAVFEQNIYDRIKYVFDSAVLRTTSRVAPFNNGIVTGEMFCDWICKNASQGFAYIFGAQVIQNGVTKTYSTIQWNYEEAHGLSHSVAGTINDFINITRHGTAEVRIQLPRQLVGNTSTDLNPGRFSHVKFGEPCRFGWWTDAEMQAYRTLSLDPIRYADGTDYEADYSTSNFDDAVTCGITTLADANSISINPYDLSDFTLRDIVSASYETQCQFGQLSRVTDLFSGVELNRSRLYPAEGLHPHNGLYPNGSHFSGFKATYSKLWADEGNVHKWRYLIITFKTLDGEGQETEDTLQRTINNDGTDDYNCSDNWLFRNLIWTEAQIGEYADAMVAKMRDITWFPFEMWCAGLPYLEVGDEIEIPLNRKVYTSYVLQRQLKGIQNLQDTYINGTLDIF